MPLTCALTTRRRLNRWSDSDWRRNSLAPQVGFEPTTLRLTAECSTVELLRSKSMRLSSFNQSVDWSVNSDTITSDYLHAITLGACGLRVRRSGAASETGQI